MTENGLAIQEAITMVAFYKEQKDVIEKERDSLKTHCVKLEEEINQLRKIIKNLEKELKDKFSSALTAKWVNEYRNPFYNACAGYRRGMEDLERAVSDAFKTKLAVSAKYFKEIKYCTNNINDRCDRLFDRATNHPSDELASHSLWAVKSIKAYLKELEKQLLEIIVIPEGEDNEQPTTKI